MWISLKDCKELRARGRLEGVWLRWFYWEDEIVLRAAAQCITWEDMFENILEVPKGLLKWSGTSYCTLVGSTHLHMHRHAETLDFYCPSWVEPSCDKRLSHIEKNKVYQRIV